MNEAQKKLLVHGDVIIVGIDVAKHNHWARIYNQIELDVVKPFKFHNSKEGYYRLVAKMEEAKEKAGATIMPSTVSLAAAIGLVIAVLIRSHVFCAVDTRLFQMLTIPDFKSFHTVVALDFMLAHVSERLALIVSQFFITR